MPGVGKPMPAAHAAEFVEQRSWMAIMNSYWNQVCAVSQDWNGRRRAGVLVDPQRARLPDAIIEHMVSATRDALAQTALYAPGRVRSRDHF